MLAHIHVHLCPDTTHKLQITKPTLILVHNAVQTHTHTHIQTQLQAEQQNRTYKDSKLEGTEWV